MSELPTPVIIEDDAELEDFCVRLRQARYVAVDTEADSMHRYREKVCLIQISAMGEDTLIDPLALGSLEPLRDIFENRKQTKIFHDAGYDLLGLRRDFGLTVSGVFDTMWASRLLGCAHFGLGSILQERYEFSANKSLQRSDWAQRPLTQEQVHYARYDTHFLEDLTLHLVEELRDSDRLHWAEEDFERIPVQAERLMERQRNGSEHAWWRVRGVKKLVPDARGRARSLYHARDRIAERLDRPPFKVFGDALIIDLATDPPKTLDDLVPRKGLRKGGAQRFGREILRALADSQAVPGRPPPGVGRRRGPRFLDPEVKARYEALRQVRRERADELGVDPEVTLSNHHLEKIARKPPSSAADLLEMPILQGWRKDFFVAPIMTVLETLK